MTGAELKMEVLRLVTRPSLEIEVLIQQLTLEQTLRQTGRRSKLYTRKPVV